MDPTRLRNSSAVKGPVSGATVSAYGLSNGTAGSALASATTDTHGAFTLSIGDESSGGRFGFGCGPGIDELQNDAGRHVSVREERRHARVGVVRTWLKPSPIGFLNHPTRHVFFTGKGGVGKTSLSTAAALTLVDPIGFAELSKLVNKPSAATATR